jgi:hypothetical protein
MALAPFAARYREHARPSDRPWSIHDQQIVLTQQRLEEEPVVAAMVGRRSIAALVPVAISTAAIYVPALPARPCAREIRVARTWRPPLVAIPASPEPPSRSATAGPVRMAITMAAIPVAVAVALPPPQPFVHSGSVPRTGRRRATTTISDRRLCPTRRHLLPPPRPAVRSCRHHRHRPGYRPHNRPGSVAVFVRTATTTVVIPIVVAVVVAPPCARRARVPGTKVRPRAPIFDRILPRRRRPAAAAESSVAALVRMATTTAAMCAVARATTTVTERMEPPPPFARYATAQRSARPGATTTATQPPPPPRTRLLGLQEMLQPSPDKMNHPLSIAVPVRTGTLTGATIAYVVVVVMVPATVLV